MRLADSLLLPLNCSDYAESLEAFLHVALELYKQPLDAHSISLSQELTCLEIHTSHSYHCYH